MMKSILFVLLMNVVTTNRVVFAFQAQPCSLVVNSLSPSSSSPLDGIFGFKSCGSNHRRRIAQRPDCYPIFLKAAAGLDTNVSSNQNNNDTKEERVRDIKIISPLLEYGYPPAVSEYEQNQLSQKPLLLYLPGFDGTFICPFLQFPELSTEFDVRCLTISMQDRSTFDELKQDVLDFIVKEINGEQTAIIDDRVVEPTNKLKANTKEEVEHNEETSTGKNVFSKLFNFSNDDDNNSSGPPAADNEVTQQQQRKSQRQIRGGGSRPIYLVGESFGGILSCEVALSLLDDNQLKSNIKGLVLINSATCYDRCKLKSQGEPILDSPKGLYPFKLFELLNLFLDEYSMQQLLLIFQGKGLPSVIDTAAREAYMGRVAFSLPFVLKYFNQGTFQWRLQQWLSAGCARVEPKLDEFAARHKSFRTLIISGEKDLALPSIAEAERLAQILPNSFVHVVDGAGHSSTCGSRLDLTAIMRFWFKELQKQQRAPNDNNNESNNNKRSRQRPRRTAMKEIAAIQSGAYFGLEPRYDGKTIGLNPLSYWSKDYYRPVKKQ